MQSVSARVHVGEWANTNVLPCRRISVCSYQPSPHRDSAVEWPARRNAGANRGGRVPPPLPALALRGPCDASFPLIPDVKIPSSLRSRPASSRFPCPGAARLASMFGPSFPSRAMYRAEGSLPPAAVGPAFCLPGRGPGLRVPISPARHKAIPSPHPAPSTLLAAPRVVHRGAARYVRVRAENPGLIIPERPLYIPNR